MKNSHPSVYPGDIIEYPGTNTSPTLEYTTERRMAFPTWPTSPLAVSPVFNSYSDSRLVLFGRALRSEVKLDPLLLLGKNYKVNNMLDDSFPARDFHGVVKPAIDDLIGREMTFDILYHNSEHQATMLRYGVKKSQQIEKVYEAIMPAWKKEFENKTL
ncbi:hypothetical protein WMY93_022946 [Mugilogobius chulae]|uniref:LRAT domain-containing protein n=1 Tax=Mugilogobius chulae TaxID=88201 RepID=A0AAW0N2Y2_9GOBI